VRARATVSRGGKPAEGSRRVLHGLAEPGCLPRTRKDVCRHLLRHGGDQGERILDFPVGKKTEVIFRIKHGHSGDLTVLTRGSPALLMLFLMLAMAMRRRMAKLWGPLSLRMRQSSSLRLTSRCPLRSIVTS